jgi:hypothetical protein
MRESNKTVGTLRNEQATVYEMILFRIIGCLLWWFYQKIILDRLDNGIEPLTTSVSELSIGKRYRKKSES